MATTTFHDYDGNGSTTTFAFTFPTFKEAEVVVEVDNVIKTTSSHYNISSYSTANGGNVVFTSGNIPGAGTKNIRIYRDTDVDNAKATYTAGSSVKAGDLNNNQLQALRALQEEQNQTVTTSRIKDGAVTSAKIKDDTIVNADINSAAEIAVSKLADGAARQVLQTAADGSSVEWTNNVDLPGTLDVTGATTLDGTLAAGATTVTGNITVSGTVDGRDIAADGTKLDGIEAGATADQTNAEIRTAVEAASDSNVFTDADHSKLNGIEAAADVTDATNVNAAGAVMNTDTTTADMQFVVDEDNFSSDSATKVPTQQSTKAYIASASQPLDADLTTLAGMQSGTASILAGGTALTATLTEINTVVDGKGVQTTISDSDAHYPTSGAVVDYVAAQIAPIGGLEVIANKDSFPETQPASGVVISIADAGGIVVNGSGTSTTPDTISSDATVTINNINSSFNSSTVDSGVGWLVTSTGSGQIYNYHKANIKESDVVQLSDDINDFNSRYRTAANRTADGDSSNDDGDLFYDQSTNKMYVHDGSTWGEVTSVGDYKLLTVVPAGASSGTPDYSNTEFDLRDGSSAASVTSVGQLLISVNGVLQKPNAGTSIAGSDEGFCLADSNTIKFATAPGSGASVFVTQIGSATAVNTPATNSIVEAAIQTNVVSEEKLKISNAGSNGQFLSKQSGNSGGLTWASVTSTPEGEAILSTTNSNEATTKYLRADGDGTCSWQLAVDSTKLATAGGTMTGNINLLNNNLILGPTGEIEWDSDDGDAYRLKLSATTTLTKDTDYVLPEDGSNGQALTTNGSGALSWADVSSTVANGCIYENDQTISADYTIASGKGAHSVGPITVNATVTVNGNWVVS